MLLLKKYFKFTVRSWLAETRLRISTLFILIFTYAVTLFLIQSAFNFKSVMNRWGDSTKLTVYLMDGQTPATRSAILKYIEGEQEVSAVKYISQEEAINQFRSKNSIFSKDFLDDLKSQEVFPESYEATLKGSFKNAAYFSTMEALSKRIGEQVGVEEVSYGQGWIERYAAFLRLTNSLVAVIVVLFVCASLLIISNLIRVLVYNQMQEIEILELIGETAQNIRWPYVLEGMAFSFAAFLTGLTLNIVIFYWISSEFASSSMLSHLAEIVSQPSLLFIFSGLILSLFVGLFSAFWTVRSINTGWALSSRTN